jgi:hypothetical protein
MPFKSEAQRRFMWSQHPQIAEAWSHGKSSKTGKKEFKPHNKGLPKHVKSSASKNRRHQQSTVNRRLWSGKAASGR